MKKVFTIYSDPCHGWLKVPTRLLHDFNIADQVTSYSYASHDGAYIFLEEDCDLSLFIRRFREVNGCDPVFREYHTNRDSRIRNYPSATSVLR